MSTDNLQMDFQNLGCFPHQTEFAAKFLATNSERMHLLTSLPGLGKGFVGSAIVGYAVTHRQARRVLVLAPTALTFQWAEMMRRTSADVFCTIVDRRRLRELQSQQECGDSLWNQAGVFVMSIDFAKRPDVADVLTQASWDFLVVDEAHQLAPQTQRQQVVTNLLNDNSDMRVLFLNTLSQTLEGDQAVNSLFKDIATTVWSRDTVRDKDGSPLLPEVQIEWISHQRRADEVELLLRLQDALQVITSYGRQSQLVATLLLKAASSSLFALEQQLNRMHQRKSQITHGMDEFVNDIGDDADLWSDERETDESAEHQPPALVKFIDRTTKVLEMLDAVDTDSKLESLLSLLQRLGVLSSSDRRVCIFTSYVDTATYLESALSEHHSHVEAVTGSLSFAEREQAVADFARNGGILITTSAMSILIPEVAAVIFYDLPMNPATLDTRIGQFIRVGRSGPVHVFAFADETNTLIIERLQRKAIEIKRAFGSDEVEKQLFLGDGLSPGESQENKG